MSKTQESCLLKIDTCPNMFSARLLKTKLTLYNIILRKETDNKMQDEKYYILSLDIETSGSDIEKNKINGIGVALMSLHAKTKEIKFEEGIEYGLPCEFPREYEPRCVAEFWEKVDKSRGFDGPELRNYLENSVPTYHQQGEKMKREDIWRMVLDFISDCQDKHPYLRIVTDNPGFDVPRVGYEISHFLNEKPLEYRRPKKRAMEKDEVYGSVISLTDVARGVLLKQEGALMLERKWVSVSDTGVVTKCPYNHDHHPLSDAKNIGWKYLSLVASNI